jgi:hypothetical protein
MSTALSENLSEYAAGIGILTPSAFLSNLYIPSPHYRTDLGHPYVSLPQPIAWSYTAFFRPTPECFLFTPGLILPLSHVKTESLDWSESPNTDTR